MDRDEVLKVFAEMGISPAVLEKARLTLPAKVPKPKTAAALFDLGISLGGTPEDQTKNAAIAKRFGIPE